MKRIVFSAVTALAILVGVIQVEGAPIHNAASNGDLAGVEQELNNGVDVDLTETKHGTTALIWAAMCGHTESVQLLIERSAKVNHADNEGDTALILAAKYGYTESVQLLIDRGAKVNHANNDEDTALISAATGGHKEIVSTLLPLLEIEDVLAKNSKGKTAIDVTKTENIQQLIQDNLDIKKATRRGYKIKSARNVDNKKHS